MKRTRNTRKSRARCLCGLRVALHFTPNNVKLDCWEAAARHQRATVKPTTLRDALIASAAGVR